MKKILAFVLCAILLSLAAMPVMASNLTITAPKGTVTIDGVKDAVYSDWFDFKYIEQDDGAGGKIAVAWDDDNIYCIVEVYDTTPFHDNGTDWQTDNVEFFFDWNNHEAEGDITNEDEPFWQARIHTAPGENDYGITAHANNRWNPEDFESIKFVVVPIGAADLSGGYIIEAAFPRSAVEGGMVLTEGKVLGFDATISDAHDDDSRYSTGFLYNHDDYDMPSDMWTNPAALKALLVLGPAAAAPEPDPTPDPEPAPTPNPGTVAPSPAPTTGDAGIITLAAALIIAAAGVVILRRKTAK